MSRASRIVRAILVNTLVFLLALCAFRALVILRIQGGDTVSYTSTTYATYFYPVRFVYHMREPGAVWILQTVFGVLYGFGGSKYNYGQAIQAFTWTSIFCGAVFAVLAWNFAHIVAQRRKSRAAVFISAFCGLYAFVFFGHLELYAPLICGLMAIALAAAFHVRRGADIGWVLAAFAISATIHRVTVFVAPALIFLVPPAPRGFFCQRIMKRVAVAGLVFAGFHIACTLACMSPFNSWFGAYGPIPMETYNWLPELLTPLTQAQLDYVRQHSQLGSFHLFTLGSVLHWKHYLFFLLSSCPLALPVIIVARKRITDPLQKFLLAMACCGWTWAFFWHPHMSYSDWDLFTYPGLFANLLAGLLVAGAIDSTPLLPESTKKQ